MAVGLPCIPSDLPALRETYSGTAVFVPLRNVDKLAESILNLLENPRRQEEFGKKREGIGKTVFMEASGGERARSAQKSLQQRTIILKSARVSRKTVEARNLCSAIRG